QPFVRSAKALRTMTRDNFITRHGEGSEHQVVLWKTCVNQRFQIPIVLHSIRKRIADQRNVIVAIQLQRSASRQRYLRRRATCATSATWLGRLGGGWSCPEHFA